MFLGGVPSELTTWSTRSKRSNQGGREDGAGGVGVDGVAAFEDSQRASLFELQGQARQALALGPKQAFGANAEIGSAAFEAQAKRCNLHAKIKRDDAQVRNGEPFA